MHNRLQQAIQTLTEDQREKGELPRGFLYCMHCIPKLYEGVIRFFGLCPKEAHGICDACKTSYTVHSNGDLISWERDNRIPRFILAGKGNTDLWNHVCRHA